MMAKEDKAQVLVRLRDWLNGPDVELSEVSEKSLTISG